MEINKSSSNSVTSKTKGIDDWYPFGEAGNYRASLYVTECLGGGRPYIYKSLYEIVGKGQDAMVVGCPSVQNLHKTAASLVPIF